MGLYDFFGGGNAGNESPLPTGGSLQPAWRAMLEQQLDPDAQKRAQIAEALAAFGASASANTGDALGAIAQGAGAGANAYHARGRKDKDENYKKVGEQAEFEADEKARKERLRIMNERLKLAGLDSASSRRIADAAELRNSQLHKFDLKEILETITGKIAGTNADNQVKVTNAQINKDTAPDAIAGTNAKNQGYVTDQAVNSATQPAQVDKIIADSASAVSNANVAQGTEQSNIDGLNAKQDDLVIQNKKNKAVSPSDIAASIMKNQEYLNLGPTREAAGRLKLETDRDAKRYAAQEQARKREKHTMSKESHKALMDKAKRDIQAHKRLMEGKGKTTFDSMKFKETLVDKYRKSINPFGGVIEGEALKAVEDYEAAVAAQLGLEQAPKAANYDDITLEQAIAHKKKRQAAQK